MALGLIIMPNETNRNLLAELIPEALVSPTYQSGNWRFIIRFGDASGSDDNCFILNRAAVLSATDLLNAAQEHWQTSSVRFLAPGKRLTFYRRYRVQVFDLFPIYMRRSEIGRRRSYAVRPQSSQETRRVGELAVRAFYTAGLDVGSVDIGLSSGGKLYILGINTCPRMTRSIGVTYAKYIRSWIERMDVYWSKGTFSSLLNMKETKCPNYLLGADPEFALRDARTGRMVFASDYFPMQGLIGCDARRVKVGRSGYPLAEVRPRPTQCPLDLYEGIVGALRRANSLVPNRHIEWRAGTLPFSKLPVGGHIHFGMLPTSGLLRALDSYLAVIFLLLENPAAARSRRRRYGWLGDHRLKTHGGFEYRVVPSWLVSPVFARGALCLAKVIGCDWYRLHHDVFVNPEARSAFRRADQEYFRSELAGLLLMIRSLPSYGSYAQEIEAMLAYVEQNKRWKTSANLRRSWRLLRRRRRSRASSQGLG